MDDDKPTRPPSERTKRELTADDYEAFRAAAGSWSDVDTDSLIADIYARRKRPSRPPFEPRRRN